MAKLGPNGILARTISALFRLGDVESLSSSEPGEGADLVGLDPDGAAGLTGKNLGEAVRYVWSQVLLITGGDGLSADDVPYDNATSGLTATDVQAAIDEVLASDVYTAKAGFITQAGDQIVDVAPPAGFSFAGLRATASHAPTGGTLAAARVIAAASVNLLTTATVNADTVDTDTLAALGAPTATLANRAHGSTGFTRLTVTDLVLPDAGVTDQLNVFVDYVRS